MRSRPAAAGEAAQSTTASRYQHSAPTGSDETLYVSVRYQLPDSGQIMETGSALAAPETFGPMSADMAFASAVAAFGLILGDSDYKADASLGSLLDRAMANRGDDLYGYRAEFTQPGFAGRVAKRGINETLCASS